MREGSKPDRAETAERLGLRREPDPNPAATGEGRARLNFKTLRLRQGATPTPTPTPSNVVTCRGMSRPVVHCRGLSEDVAFGDDAMFSIAPARHEHRGDDLVWGHDRCRS